jgi:MFS family permease
MSSSATGSSSVWRVLRTRNFGPYFVGNAMSASGTWFQNLAASIFVYQLTHSALLLGVLNACQFGPVLLLSPLAGRIADTVDRRRLLIWTQAISVVISATLAALVWVGVATTWMMIGFAAVLGTTATFAIPAQMALVGSLVPRESLAQAVALNSMTFNVARAVGPAAAAAVIALFGIAPAIAVNSLSYLALATALIVITPSPVPRVRRARFRDSLGILRAQPRLAGYLGIVMAIAMTADPVNTESPAIAHTFGHSPVWAGAVVGFFGLGAVLAAATTTGRGARSDRQLATSLLIFGGGMVLMAISPWFPLALAFVLGAGFGYLSANATATARLQLGVAAEEWGRIMALWSVAFLGTRPVASLVDGAIAGWAGVRVAACVLALPVMIAALMLMRSRGTRTEPPARSARADVGRASLEEDHDVVEDEVVQTAIIAEADRLDMEDVLLGQDVGRDQE